jgi:hypothetical protein
MVASISLEADVFGCYDALRRESKGIWKMLDGIDPKTASGWVLAAFVLFMQYGLPWLKSVLKVRTEQERIKARIDEKGYKEVVAELGAELKLARDEVKQNRDDGKLKMNSLEEEVRQLRISEHQCQIAQARMEVELKSARDCITEQDAEIASLKADLKQMKGDSKSRQPSAEERAEWKRARGQTPEDGPPQS